MMRDDGGFTIYELIFILLVITIGVYFLTLYVANGVARARVADFVHTAESISEAVRTYTFKERPISIEVATLNLQRLERLNYLPPQGGKYLLRVVDHEAKKWDFYRPVGRLEYPQGHPSLFIAYTGKVNSLFVKHLKRWAEEHDGEIYIGEVSLPGFTDAVLHFRVSPYDGRVVAVFFPLR